VETVVVAAAVIVRCVIGLVALRLRVTGRRRRLEAVLTHLPAGSVYVDRDDSHGSEIHISIAARRSP
jgi:hypothetical protein